MAINAFRSSRKRAKYSAVDGKSAACRLKFSTCRAPTRAISTAATSRWCGPTSISPGAATRRRLMRIGCGRSWLGPGAERGVGDAVGRAGPGAAAAEERPPDRLALRRTLVDRVGREMAVTLRPALECLANPGRFIWVEFERLAFFPALRSREA